MQEDYPWLSNNQAEKQTECLQTHDWIRRSDPVPTTSLEFNNIEKVYLVRDRDQLKKNVDLFYFSPIHLTDRVLRMECVRQSKILIVNGKRWEKWKNRRI